MHVRRSIRLLVVASSLSCSSLALAQAGQSTQPEADQPAQNDYDSDNVVIVEGQRVRIDQTELAADFVDFGTQVQIISDDEIDTGGFTNFGELAAGLIRGANIGYSPDEGEFTIRIDGGTDRDTLLLVDGVPYFDRSSPSETIWPATAIDPRMIDNVEVFRGGQSLYFGSNGGLGVVSVNSKEPDGRFEGEIGVYGGSFKTREIYGNVSVPLPIGEEGEHSIMVFGRSYETDSNILFDRDAFADTLLELGGFREYPYSYNNLGAKYLWQIDPDTEFRAAFQLASVDFEDTFPNSTPYAPNKTEFPIFNASFKSQLNDRARLVVEGHYQAPKLRNTELDPLVCSIPRVQDLPAGVRGSAPAGGFATAADYEAFAAANDLPAGCVTNPQFNFGRANVEAQEGIYVNPETGEIYGTLDNPFPIGNPMGFVTQSVANFGSGAPFKGIGEGDQYTSSYVDYGINGRLTYRWNDWFETVVGVQNTSYHDNSDEIFGVRDVTLSSTGVYGDLRFTLPLLEGFNASIAGRHDFNNNFSNETLWKVGLRQELPGGFYLRGNGGTSYSLPTINELGAFGASANLNPGLQPQEVESYSVGAGINGHIGDGTFNIEVGYYDTEITNLFSNRAVEAVCLEYANDVRPDGELSRDVIEANRSLIVPPDAFCATAAAADLSGDQTVAVNQLSSQDIKGWTVDMALDLDLVQFDISFTKSESLEPNPVYGVAARLDGTTTNLDFVVPGPAGNNEFRQSAERPEWALSGLITLTPSDRWVFALNPRYQGPEWAYAGTSAARLVDANGERVLRDVNFGEYFVLNGSIQYYMGEEKQHRFMVRLVNILDEDYFERASGGSDLRISRAAVRGEIGPEDSAYYRQYGWNGKPRSIWVQYEYNF
ncbi:TonB-dependent receptor plug domain-containing protein [Aurantiacibacter suaedae]|uniref:TonB-dependent receptor plug domain-containing protein n=1 Tax=Aurantiacibacter suaedae TaxID=2545755 RepID=UPI0010F7887C|nr:TonB-dependent receptor plug domain-containing protein [Aurantiacibacter suaedae]